jgi:hypothetical protein
MIQPDSGAGNAAERKFRLNQALVNKLRRCGGGPRWSNNPWPRASKSARKGIPEPPTHTRGRLNWAGTRRRSMRPATVRSRKGPLVRSADARNGRARRQWLIRTAIPSKHRIAVATDAGVSGVRSSSPSGSPSRQRGSPSLSRAGPSVRPWVPLAQRSAFWDPWRASLDHCARVAPSTLPTTVLPPAQIPTGKRHSKVAVAAGSSSPALDPIPAVPPAISALSLTRVAAAAPGTIDTSPDRA